MYEEAGGEVKWWGGEVVNLIFRFAFFVLHFAFYLPRRIPGKHAAGIERGIERRPAAVTVTE